MDAQLIFNYFPNLTQQQQDQFIALRSLVSGLEPKN